jgi:hypothetical protein
MGERNPGVAGSKSIPFPCKDIFDVFEVSKSFALCRLERKGLDELQKNK